MTVISNFALSRREFLRAGAGLVAATAVLKPPPGFAADAVEYKITPGSGQVALGGKKGPLTDVWAYDGRIPGPEIRLRQGRSAHIVVENRLEEDTTVHWHGIRLPNAMDGVPGLTQPPIKPGESFVYEFTPPDAGTFWYHPHADSLQQLGRGLAGALIVEEAEPVHVDRDLLWVLTDWRLNSEGQIASGFGNRMEAAMSGRVGNVVTLNGKVPGDQSMRAGERVRLRLVNTSLARIMALKFEGHSPFIVAIDGQPCDPHEPDGGRLLLGPAMRIDLIIDMQGAPGSRHVVVDDYYDGLSYELTALAYTTQTPLRKSPLDASLRLPGNPLPEPDIRNAERLELALQGGMMSHTAADDMKPGMQAMPGMTAGRALWSINGTSMTGDGHAGMPPLVTLAQGRSHIVSMRNDTAWWHPMHLHGFSFRVLKRNGVAVPHNQWADTVLLAPRDVVEVAFVADNPGDWMLHCHVTDHQMAGLMTVLRVGNGRNKT
ncbi:multicopper oxidase family protein [Mesorhizobium sp. YR577]|uniref:multicopper oxidase family protein n=1 Tax=Mesorhizobium sp. YR577 TaxID=1884373 RepID=UPI0008F1099D|nr:multicopper oxidase family protein [Mesorhizobium sp. YR577]SFU23275.1 Multicopper oxidase with three cupredoxin domains (includes cell division protein FtsP and spore coat protein CotA) [Mesorhizobium sp. YR577]